MDGENPTGEGSDQPGTGTTHAAKIAQRVNNSKMATLGDRLAGKDHREGNGESLQQGAAPEIEEEWVWNPCYSARKSSGPVIRLAFRCPNDLCISLPYSGLIDIEFGHPKGYDHVDCIKMDYAHYYYIALIGSNLEPVFNRLQTHSVAWVKQGNPDERVVGQPFIDWINHEKLTDPNVALAALKHQQLTLLGKK